MIFARCLFLAAAVLVAGFSYAGALECQPVVVQHPSGDPALEFIDVTAADRCAAGQETAMTLAVQSLAFGLLVAGALFIGFSRKMR